MDGCSGLVVQHFAATGQGLSSKSDTCWDIPWAASDPVAVGSRGEVTWLWSIADQVSAGERDLRDLRHVHALGRAARSALVAR